MVSSLMGHRRAPASSMAAPVTFVLSLALVFSIVGTTLDQTADHDNGTMKITTAIESNVIYDEIYDLKIETRTKLDKSNVNHNNNNILSNQIVDSKLIDIPDAVFTENVKEDIKSKEETTNKNKYNGIHEAQDFTNYDNHVNGRQVKLNKYSRQFNEHKGMREYHDTGKQDIVKSRDRRETETDPCNMFKEHDGKLTHPHTATETKLYARNITCTEVLSANDGEIITLTFVNIFQIEAGPENACIYDFLEIRDGPAGYFNLLNKLCGSVFPSTITSTGPYLWLKFKSDDTIEYEGFQINIARSQGIAGNMIPPECNSTVLNMNKGVIDSKQNLSDICVKYSSNRALEAIWTIITPKDTKIFLNFSNYALEAPNECEKNVVQVYGYLLEYDANLAHYCGSVANQVTTRGDSDGAHGNIMYIRIHTAKGIKDSSFTATFTAFWSLDPSKDDQQCKPGLFNCEDNTCVDEAFKCDQYGDCRLKADEDGELCKGEAESIVSQTHIMVILVIFCLILSGMSFVFLFKCFRKLYQDHKIIKEHIKQSTEDRLDAIASSRLTLNPRELERDSEPRSILERENHTNEMFKQQRKLSKHRKPSSIDLDFQETHLDLDDESWHPVPDNIPIRAQDIKIERNGRSKTSSASKREESMRSKTKESEEQSKRKEIRDVSVGAPDTKESGCQTRESLFQTENAPSSDGSGTNSRGLSTFGYSGGTIVRPSPPPATSQITIELLKQTPHQEKSQKKLPDRRPMSTETTRSAPDVIIVSKPIR